MENDKESERHNLIGEIGSEWVVRLMSGPGFLGTLGSLRDFENTAKLADDIFDGYKKPANWSDDFHDKVRKVLDEPQAKQLAVDMKHHKTLKAAIKADR